MAGVVVCGACAGDPTPQQQPDVAARQVAALLLLDEPVASCIDERFRADPGLAAIVNTGAGEQLPPARLAAATAAITGCATPEQLRDGLVRLVAANVPGGTQPGTCLTEAVSGLADADRDLLVVWAINAAALDNAAQLRVGEVGGELARTCGVELPLDVGGDEVVGGGGDAPTSGTPTVSLDTGAAQVER